MARTGRPHKLDDVIVQRPVIDPDTKAPTGATRPVTRIEQIVGDIRIGMNAERAAKRAGIHRETLNDWERQASELRQRIANSDTEIDLTDKQATLLEFSDALHGAELEWQTQCEMLLQQSGQGGIEQVETHVTMRDGKVVEERTVTKVTLPDPRVVQWRLKHRFPREYADRVQIEGTGEDGAIPLEVRAESVGEALAQFIAAREQQGQGRDDPETQQEPP